MPKKFTLFSLGLLMGQLWRLSPINRGGKVGYDVVDKLRKKVLIETKLSKVIMCIRSWFNDLPITAYLLVEQGCSHFFSPPLCSKLLIFCQCKSLIHTYTRTLAYEMNCYSRTRKSLSPTAFATFSLLCMLRLILGQAMLLNVSFFCASYSYLFPCSFPLSLLSIPSLTLSQLCLLSVCAWEWALKKT